MEFGTTYNKLVVNGTSVTAGVRPTAAAASFLLYVVFLVSPQSLLFPHPSDPLVYLSQSQPLFRQLTMKGDWERVQLIRTSVTGASPGGDAARGGDGGKKKVNQVFSDSSCVVEFPWPII